MALEADYLATGHYARIERRKGSYRLLRSVDRCKDQSYVLYTLGASDLERLLMPVGGLYKEEVRRIALEKGLSNWDRRESQDICFIPDGDYRRFVAGRIEPRPGHVCDSSGRLLGVHQGIAFYTIGQRQRLEISSGERLYVIGIDADENRLILGSRHELEKDALFVGEVSYVLGEAPEGPLQVTAMVRYRSAEIGAMLWPLGRRARLHFERPLGPVTPGQAAVFYQGDVLLGDGIIE
ncbi:MnmA/TRMU family protein [Chloroflexota bacterium]